LKRKLRHKKNKQLGSPSLFVIGGGLAIVILIGVFVLNYDNYRKRNIDYSYSDLKDNYSVINDKEAYEFMNYALFGASNIVADSLEFIKLNCFSLMHTSQLKSFINSSSDTLLNSSDKKFMRQQLNNKLFLWNNEALINVWCLTPEDFAKINYSDTTDYWEQFRANFGEYGLHYYSKPIFNEVKNICIIEHSGQRDWLFGSGDILLFKKINGNWKLLIEENLWIS
jgi:hypothetical protein